MTTDLVFDAARATGSPTHLVMGALVGEAPGRTLSTSVTFGGLTTTAMLIPAVKVEVAVTFGGLSVSSTVFYDNRVTPYKENRVLASHQPAIPDENVTPGAWQISAIKRDGTNLPWAPAALRNAGADVGHATARFVNTLRDAPADTADKLAQAAASAYQKAVFKVEGASGGYKLGDDRRTTVLGRLQTGVFIAHARAGVYQTGGVAGMLFDGVAGASVLIENRHATNPWQLAGWPAPGLSLVILPPGVTPPLVISRDLLFACPPLAFPNLVFGAQPCYLVPASQAAFYILPARFYMTTHNVYAQRLPDLAEVPIFDATVSADAGSFCWALSASGPASLFELLAPVNGLPVQLRVMLDGLPWVFAVDGLSRTGSFGKSGVSVTGRSVTALIGAPYLRAVTRDNAGGSLLAQQLALGALENSGVGLDWGLTD